MSRYEAMSGLYERRVCTAEACIQGSAPIFSLAIRSTATCERCFSVSYSVDWIESHWDEVLIDVIQRAVRVSPEWSKIIAAAAMLCATHPLDIREMPWGHGCLIQMDQFDQV
jgi:hypothetical protein